jgi:hypothetical protein
LTDLRGIVQLAQLHVGAAQPEQRQISDDTVRITLEEILQHSRGLIVASLVVQVLAFRKHGLLCIAGDIAVLLNGSRRTGGGCHFNDRCKRGEHQRRRQRCCA